MNNNQLAIKTIQSMVDASTFKGVLKANLSIEEDPNAQARNRKDLNKKLKVRLAHAQKEIIKLFNNIPREARTEKNLHLNQDTFTVYDYDLSPEKQDQLESQIQEIIFFWLLLGQSNNKPFDFYADQNVEQAYRSGALEVVRDLNSQLDQIAILGLGLGAIAELLPRSFDQNALLFSQIYLDNLSIYKSDIFYEIKGLSEKASSQVYERIISGIQSKSTPRTIIKDIKKRFSVSESSAKRIVNTSINKAYNDSVINAIDFVRQTTNINAAGRHRSALLSTTRPSHASRHNNIYTTEQQLRWWNSGANRINCYCSFGIVVLDKNNKEILQKQ